METNYTILVSIKPNPTYVSKQKFRQLINPIFHISLTVSANRTIYIAATRALTNHRAAIGARLNFELLHSQTKIYRYESRCFKIRELYFVVLWLIFVWFLSLLIVRLFGKCVLPLIYAFVR